MTLPGKKSTGRKKDQAQSDAHLKRCWEMAKTGLFKEAAILWEHAARLSPTPLDQAPYLVMLVNSQQVKEAAALFFADREEITTKHPELAANLTTLIAAHLLSGTAGIKDTVPDSDPLHQELKTARGCLNALCRGDHKRLEKQVAKVGAKSPFADFARIMRSLAIPGNKPQQLLEPIAAISPHSPFANLARAAGIRTLNGAALARALTQVPEADQRLIAGMMGIADPTLALLNGLGSAVKDSEIIKLLLDHPDPLPGEWIKPTFLDLLVDNIGKRAAVEKRIGAFDKLENARLLALHHQRKKHRVRANSNWKRYLKLTEKLPKSRERSLTLAQLENHFATLEESAPWPSRMHIIEHLQEAQNHDPQDSRTMLRLIHWFRQDEDQSGLHGLIAEALDRFPKNPEILMAASEIAYGNRAYKKAAGLAKKAVKLAPDSAENLTRQLDAQMQHARKRMKKGKIDIARQELARAVKNAGEKHPLLSEIFILQAIAAAKAGDGMAEQNHLEQMEKLARTSPYHHFYFLLEAGGMAMGEKTLAAFTVRLDKSATAAPDKTSTKKMVLLAKEHCNRKNPILATAVSRLRDYLEKAARLDFSKNEMKQICEGLHAIKQFDELALFAKAGEKRWKGEAAFLFFRIHAESGGETYRISDEDFFTLREALPTAVRRGDDVTARRIDGLMGHSPSGSRRNLGALSPAKIPKPLERQLVRSLKKRINAEFGGNDDIKDQEKLRGQLLERLADSEYASRGPFILAYLIDKALNREEGPTAKRKKSPPPPTRQLEMDLFE